MRFFSLALLFWVPFTLGARDLKPWFGEDLWLELKVSDRVVTYDSIKIDGSELPQSSRNNYSLVCGSFAADDWLNAQIELGLAQRDQRSNWMDFDHLALTGRYLVMNDVAGDFLTLTLGVTGVIPHSSGVRDLNHRHHGYGHGEIHLAMGKELVCGETWSSRSWVYGGIGQGSRGSPWWRGSVGVESWLCDQHRLALSFDALGGWGKQALDVDRFGGYDSIAHRSLDVGLDWVYDMGLSGEASIGWRNRLWARNTPKDVYEVHFSCLWLIGVL